MFYDSLHGLVRVLLVTGLAYAILVTILRVSGKRTLASMSAFDFVVTVALGSVLATVALSKEVALAEGVAAFVVLAALQFLVAWAAQRFPAVEKAVKSRPRVLLLDGVVDPAALREERVSRDEVTAAVRKAGYGDCGAVAAVVLETDGSFSVIPLDKAVSRSALP